MGKHQWARAKDLPSRIRDLISALKIDKKDLAKRAGVLPGQVSEWVKDKGQRPSKSALESWAEREGWPVEMFAEGGPMPATVVNRTVNITEQEVEPYGVDGWLWNDSEEPEEQFRRLIRNYDTSFTAMVGDPSTVVAEDILNLQLDACKAARASARAAGRMIPDFIHIVENELIDGTFK